MILSMRTQVVMLLMNVSGMWTRVVVGGWVVVSGVVVGAGWGDRRVEWRAGIDFKGSRGRSERVLGAGQCGGLGRGLEGA